MADLDEPVLQVPKLRRLNGVFQNVLGVRRTVNLPGWECVCVCVCVCACVRACVRVCVHGGGEGEGGSITLQLEATCTCKN